MGFSADSNARPILVKHKQIVLFPCTPKFLRWYNFCTTRPACHGNYTTHGMRASDKLNCTHIHRNPYLLVASDPAYIPYPHLTPQWFPSRRLHHFSLSKYCWYPTAPMQSQPLLRSGTAGQWPAVPTAQKNEHTHCNEDPAHESFTCTHPTKRDDVPHQTELKLAVAVEVRLHVRHPLPLPELGCAEVRRISVDSQRKPRNKL